MIGRLIKLALLSALLFSCLLLGITLLFPFNTVTSRAANLPGKSDSLLRAVRSNQWPLRHILTGSREGLTVRAADIPFYEGPLFKTDNAADMPKADTLFFRIDQGVKPLVSGGLAFYQLQADSVTVQCFYVFQTPWYKPLHKFRMIMADKIYGPGLDSSMIRMKVLSSSR